MFLAKLWAVAKDATKLGNLNQLFRNLPAAVE